MLNNRQRAKRFGQHFLTDPRILARIVDAAEPLQGAVVVEIGPGPGGLTREILKRNPTQVVVIEKDPLMIDALKPLGVTIFNQDAVTFDFGIIKEIANVHRPLPTQGIVDGIATFDKCRHIAESEPFLSEPIAGEPFLSEPIATDYNIWKALERAVQGGVISPMDLDSRNVPDIPALVRKIFPKTEMRPTPAAESACPIKVISNLPYNVGTAIFTNLLKHLHGVSSMTLMFQKEVAERLLAKPGSRDYGRLAVLCQYFTTGKRVMRLAPGAFVPPPKVFSDVVHLVVDAEANVDMFDSLSDFCSEIFQYKRKKLKNRINLS
ncbi:MAG: 16S rRNA (adenine(1518)-N(6)/adenine(1519)-N(6))-dimethyltransferase [Holosporales bacterium]|nr:16S rRNA (adenine(1518)-N(6)/adenine(1519)-N(6))-dimethyltransferase [Holosporales bacterium]